MRDAAETRVACLYLDGTADIQSTVWREPRASARDAAAIARRLREVARPQA
jgi:hypothetical protein